MMKYLGYVLIGLFALSFLIQEIPAIPDNAQIDVFQSQGYWLPHAPFTGDWFDEALDDPKRQELALELLSDMTPATWDDVKPGGRHEGFVLLPGRKTYTDSYTTGRSRSALMAMIFGTDERWNDDGTWNY